MSWGDPQQPYEQNHPYGQQPQQPYGQPQQPFGQAQQPPQQSQQQPLQPPQPQGWAAPQQPYNSGSGFPQNPQAPQTAPYPQGGYGQPEFAQYPLQPQPPKKGNGVFIGIVVGALLVVGGGITAAVVLTGKHTDTTAGAGSSSTATVSTSASSGGGTAVTLSAPDGVQGLTKLNGTVADAAVNQMKASLAGESEEYPDPVLGAYNDAGGNDVTTILVDQAMDKLSAADQTQLKDAGDATAVVAEIMSGAGVSDAQPQTTSAADGALSCGTKDESGTNVTICVWYDVKTFGTLQYVDNTTVGDAAPAADAVRAAAEH